MRLPGTILIASLLAGTPAASQPAGTSLLRGSVSSSGPAAAAPTSPITVQQAQGDLHHALAVEIQSMRLDPSAEQAWSRSAPVVQRYLPACAPAYQQAHNLIPGLQSAFRAGNTAQANALSAQAAQYMAQGDRCAGGADSFAANGGVGGAVGPYNQPSGPGAFFQRPPGSMPGPQAGAVPPFLAQRLADGTCRYDAGPNSPTHIVCQPVPPNCAKGVPGGYDPSANPGCRTVANTQQTPSPLPWEQPAYAGEPMKGWAQTNNSPAPPYPDAVYTPGPQQYPLQSQRPRAAPQRSRQASSRRGHPRLQGSVQEADDPLGVMVGSEPVTVNGRTAEIDVKIGNSHHPGDNINNAPITTKGPNPGFRALDGVVKRTAAGSEFLVTAVQDDFGWHYVFAVIPLKDPKGPGYDEPGFQRGSLLRR